VYVGTCYGYSGCYGNKLGTVTVGSGTTTVTDDRIAAQYAAWVDAGSFSHYLTSRGAETAGAYTYKQLNTSLSLTYKSFPAITGKTAIAPIDGASASVTPTLDVTASDPTGNGIYVRYIVSQDPAFAYSDYVSSWQNVGPLTLPEYELDPNLHYYWKAQVKDTFDGLYGVSTVRDSQVWSFLTSNLAPDSASVDGALPARDEVDGLHTGISPQFTTWASDPDQNDLSATFEVALDGGPAGPGALVGSCTTAVQPSDRVFRCSTSNTLISGTHYLARVRTSDGYLQSGWSTWLAFEADDSVLLPEAEDEMAYIPFDHAVSLGDAVDVMSNRSETVLGYRYESNDIVGEWFPDSETVSDFLYESQTKYATVPAVAQVIVLDPSATLMVGGSGMSRVRQMASLPDSIVTNKPVLVPALATGPEIQAFQASVDDAVSTENSQVVAGLVAPDATWGPMALAPSPSLLRWDPSRADIRIQKIVVSVPGGVVRKVRFDSNYYWNGVRTSPTKVDSNFGLEFSNDVVGNHYAKNAYRCELPLVPQCWPIIGASCDKSESQNWLVANMHGWSWRVYVYAASTAAASKGAKAITPYADYNDLWDECNRNSITIGLRYPEKIPQLADGSYRLRVVIDAPKGPGNFGQSSDNSDKVSSIVQAVERISCSQSESLHLKTSLTVCMGANVAVPWLAYGRPYEKLLALKPDRVGPNYCWTVSNYGLNTPVRYTCGGSWP
jgi:hypothetical protein